MLIVPPTDVLYDYQNNAMFQFNFMGDFDRGYCVFSGDTTATNISVTIKGLKS